MKKFRLRDLAADGDSSRRSRWPWFLAAGGVLALLIALLWSRQDSSPTADPALANAPEPATTANSSSAGFARRSQRRASPEAAAPAGEIVTNKVHQFSRNRREIVHALARKFKVEVPAEVERFFDAIEAGRWDEIEPLAKALRDNLARSGDLANLWPPIHEAWGAIQETSNWPAQKLLDYGDAVLGSLRPGMIYVGGTDSGRWIPTLLNETSEATNAPVFATRDDYEAHDAPDLHCPRKVGRGHRTPPATPEHRFKTAPRWRALLADLARGVGLNRRDRAALRLPAAHAGADPAALFRRRARRGGRRGGRVASTR